MSYEWIQVYFGVSTLIDASSSDSLKAEDEQKEVKFQVHYMIFSELTSSITNLPCQYPKEKKKLISYGYAAFEIWPFFSYPNVLQSSSWYFVVRVNLIICFIYAMH